RVAEGLKSRTVRVPGVKDALISPDIGVMSHIPSIVTCNALISLDFGVRSHIPSAVICGFSIWTVAGSLVASHLWDELARPSVSFRRNSSEFSLTID
ncbi:MAG TPA: hypothetical protein VF740_10075, partial [Candidatus Acidoferrum sp.]